MKTEITTSDFNNELSNNELLIKLKKNRAEAFKRGAIGLGGLISGAGLFALFGHTVMKDNDQESSEPEEILTFETEIPFSKTVSDEMSFEEAFANAREELGPGGFFNWNGSSYNTFYKEEWQNLSEDSQSEYITKVVDSSEFIPEMKIENTEQMSELATNNENENSEPLEEVEEVNDLEAEEEQEIDELEPIIGYQDTDGDGFIDALSLDIDYDGYAEAIVVDFNGDGVPDGYLLDMNETEGIDIIIIDEGQDGITGDDTTLSGEDIIVSMDEFIILEDEQIADAIEKDTEGNTENFSEDIEDFDFGDDDLLEI